MKKLFKRSVVIDILFIFILSLIPLLWFKKDVIIVGHDNVFPMMPLTFLYGRLFTWVEHGFGQSQALIMGTIPTHIIDAIPSLFGFSLQWTQKIVYIFWFFLMGIGAYILASTIQSGSRVFKLTAVVLYQINFFLLQAWWIFERTKFSAYVAFPIILALLIKVYRGELKVLTGVIYTSLILFVFNAGGLYGFPLYGGFFIAVATFIIYFSTISFFKKDYVSIKKIVFFTLFSAVGVLIVNAYYILPTVSQIISQYTVGVEKNGGVSGFINWASEISANASFINIFRLEGIAEWYDNLHHPYAQYYLNNPVLILISFIWPALVFLSVMIIKKKEKLTFVLYFFLVYLIGIFFTAGNHPPLGFLYTIFLTFVPGFIAFRSPYFKFAPAVFLSASFLIAFLVDQLRGKVKQVVFVLIILLVCVYHFPYFTGNFFSWMPGFSTRHSVPSYVFDFGTWVEKNVGNERILLLPPTAENWQYDIYQWGYLSLQSFPTLLTNKSIVTNDNKLNGEEGQFTFMMYNAIEKKDKELTKRLASFLGIKYFLVRKDASYKLDWARINNPYAYESILANEFRFPILKTFGQWEVFVLESENPTPKFVTSDSIESLDGPIYNTWDYFDILKSVPQFYIKKDKDIVKKVDLSSIPVTQNYVLSCISCKYAQIPSIGFPERNILPDSPLYPLVTFNEERQLINKDPKDNLYDYLGLTIKRISEIRQTVITARAMKKDIFQSYILLIQKIKDKFTMLSSYEQKFETAQDINYYLNEEMKVLRDLLRFNINIYSSNLKAEEEMDKIFQSIADLRAQIDQYLFKLDISKNRLYYFTLDKPGEYQFLLKKQGLENLVKDKLTLYEKIDDLTTSKVETPNTSDTNQWIVLDKKFLSPVSHTLLLTFPDTLNLAQELQADSLHIDAGEDTQCYVSGISNFDNVKTYKVSFTIPVEFNNKLYTYVKKTGPNGTKLDRLIKIGNGYPSSYEGLINSGENIAYISIGVCSEMIPKSVLEEKIKLKITEVLFPTVMLVQATHPTQTIAPVSFTKLNPTKYILKINADHPTVLSFMERFDNAWKLEKFNSSHFRVAGYANAWLVDKPGDYNLVLEYQPQILFHYGMVITALSVIGGIIILIIKKREPYDKR